MSKAAAEMVGVATGGGTETAEVCREGGGVVREALLWRELLRDEEGKEV